MKITGTISYLLQELIKFFINKKPDKEYTLLISEKENKEIRSKFQNNFFYGLFTEIGNHIGFKKDDIKGFFMSGLFGTKEIEMFGQKREISIINSTTELKKEQAIFLIESLIEFIRIHDVPCKYSSRELDSLIDSYKLG